MSRTKRDIPIDRYTVKTLAEVGAELGISAMRVWQIERKAMEKLRKEFKVLRDTGFQERSAC